MHTKFIKSDFEHFYLGSANLDWRSLNQKLELGIIIGNCLCLAKDLSNIFEKCWEIASDKYKGNNNEHLEKYLETNQRTIAYNQQRPLSISNEHVLADVYIAASPRSLNDLERDWDLFSILNAVEKATKFLYVEVMDYFSMFIYNLPRRYWPVIDNAIRRAILRGVEVKILTAAIHLPEYSLRFLSSLETLNRINDSSIEVRILKVPTDVNMQNIMKRERRMHTFCHRYYNWTSNWSGDYFDEGTTGVALVLNQTKVSLEKRHFIRDLRYIFLSHWSSNYTHDVLDYERECLQTTTGNYYEAEKDPSLLAL